MTLLPVVAESILFDLTVGDNEWGQAGSGGSAERARDDPAAEPSPASPGRQGRATPDG